MSQILPPRDDEGKSVNTSIRVPEVLLKKVDKIANDSNYSRNEVIVHFIRWATNQFEAEQTEKKSKK